MKQLFTLLTCIIFAYLNQVNAVQISACDMSYQTTTNKNIYRVTVKLYKDCWGEALCTGCENTDYLK